MNGNDLLAQIENENPKLGIYLRNYLIPTIQPRGRAGQVLATPPDAVGNASLRNLSDLVNNSNPPSASYVGTNKSGQLVSAPTPQSGITELTGDVTAGPGSGRQPTTLKVAVAGWDVFDGSAGTNLGNIQSMLRATNLSECFLTVTASDAAADLTFDIQQNGVSIFTTAPTVTHGAISGQQFTFALRTVPLPVAKNDKINLNITAGTSDWKISAVLR